MIILIDFDGTCVTHEFPNVGKDIGAVPVLRQLVENGHQLILFTMRSHKSGFSPATGNLQEGKLQDAIEWFENNGIPLYGIQTNPTQAAWTESPKAYGHMIIDDTALGVPLKHDGNRPYVDWDEVELLLHEQGLI